VKRTALRRKPRRDPVPEWLRPYVGARDQECVLSKLMPEHLCQDHFGNVIRPDSPNWEMDHIDNGGVGRRVHEKWNTVRLCPAGHVAKTNHPSRYRPILRDYAWGVEGKVAA
jgi:5-methylcytosine-specific restriction endonuclease McrA